MKKSTCTDLKSRFRVLAGIVQKDTLATLTIPNGSTIVELKTLPTWLEKLKYKLCGFECKIIRETPSTYTDFNEANKSLVNHLYGSKTVGNEDLTEADLDGLIKELEAEAQ
jgi:hypothetical protein